MQKVLIFTTNHATMKLIKLTAFSLFLLASVLTLSSCEKDAEAKKTYLYAKTGIPMTGAQNVPASTSSAVGSLDVTYIKGTRQLSYKFSWTGLTGAPTGVGIYGLAPLGYAVSPTTPIQTIALTGLTATGSYSGTLLVDGVVIKEQDLLNGLYYVLIRTAANPGGEIRAQIKFQ
jgi:hypothetical protein